MSESSKKGKDLELKIAKILRSKLSAEVARDKQSGAGINKSDINDWYRQVPLFMEAKNQKTIKIKEWFRQAENGASVGQAPTVVFESDDKLLACLRFIDLINFLVEIRDNEATIKDLRRPTAMLTNGPDGREAFIKFAPTENGLKAAEDFRTYQVAIDLAKPGADTSVEYLICPDGHIATAFGYCIQKGCKYSRGYRPPKIKK